MLSRRGFLKSVFALALLLALSATGNAALTERYVSALADGSGVLGFLCESHAIEGARDITSLGGWRAYIKSLAV